MGEVKRLAYYDISSSNAQSVKTFDGKTYKIRGAVAKLTKKLVVLSLSVSVLSACAQQENSPVNKKENTVQTHEKKEVKKHETVSLPVNVFVNKNYKIEGQQVTYSRSITDVTIQDFDEATEIEYLDLYGQSVRSQGFDLQNDYKLLVITMKQETQEEARSKPYEALMLSEGSGLVIGDSELANQNEFIMYQQEFLTTDYKVGNTLDETGNLLMAIPNSYANDPNLQIRTKQELDGEKKYIYIDVN